MLLKLISANLKACPSICSVLQVATSRGYSTSQRRIFQISRISQKIFTLQYSTEKTAFNSRKSGINRKSISSENEELSTEEIRMLNQDPDSFGTLSSFKTFVTEEIPTESENEVDSKTVSSTDKLNKSRSIESYEAHLKDLIEKGKVKEAVHFFENEMLTKNKMHAPIRTYEWLIKECVHCKEFKLAFDIYDHMVSRRLGISLELIEELILAFELSLNNSLNSISMKKINSIQKIIEKNQYKINGTMYNSLVRIYARSTQWQTAFVLAYMMKNRGFNYELETINAIFEACGHDKDYGFFHLIKYWHEMLRLKLSRNVHTFNAFLKSVKNCEMQNIDKLQNLVESIRAKSETHSDRIEDGRPNLLESAPSIGYLFPLEKVEKPEDRLLILGGLTGIFNEFKKHNVSPTLETITILLNITPNTFEAHQKVISLLKKDKMVPDLNLFNTLLTKNCLKQQYQNSKEIFEMMTMADVEVDLVSSGLLAMSCSKRVDAEDYFEEMKSRNLKFDIDILNAMLKNACESRDNDYVICILRKMQSEEIEPTEESFQMVENYHKTLFRNLRTERVPTKRMRNECFKLTREYKNWQKYFRADKPTYFGSASPLNKKRNARQTNSA